MGNQGSIHERYSSMPGINMNGDCVTARALYSYKSKRKSDLSFKKNDILYVHGDRSLSWLTAVHSKTYLCGFIPYNYVDIEEEKPVNLKGWHDISRMEAIRRLLMMGNPPGTYIIRKCENKSDFALSVRHQDAQSGIYNVNHYRIHFLRDTKRYCLTNSKTFATVADLIKFYSQNFIIHGCLLKYPYVTYQDPVDPKDLRLKRECLQIRDILGQGSFGTVYKALWNNTIPVAVKVHKAGVTHRNDLLGEAESMHKLRHPKILEILALCDEPENEPVYIVTELMELGSLASYLRKQPPGSLNLDQMIDFMAQIADGMAYLESNSYIHRDLRATNILVGQNFGLKVADFGLARLGVDTSTMEAIYQGNEDTQFPFKWTAPEAASCPYIYSTKSDVWSFGIVMYEIVTYGGSPYPNMTASDVLKKIVEPEKYRMPIPTGNGIVCSKPIYNVMLKCWNSNPNQRPTFENLKNDLDKFALDEEEIYTYVY